MAPVAVGDQVPSVTLFEDSPGGKVELESLCAGKKVVMFGVPGAFTPGCSKTHLPGYVAAAADLKAGGVDEIVCVSVNDPFVMEAWGKDQSAGGKVRMLADTTAELTKALGLELDLTAVLGNVRWDFSQSREFFSGYFASKLEVKSCFGVFWTFAKLTSSPDLSRGELVERVASVS